LTVVGALTGLAADAPPAASGCDVTWSSARQDVFAFAGASLVGVAVSVVIFDRGCTIDDEWAYTFQADLFSHFRTYANAPPCATLFGNHWIFTWQGRAFSQFTPGWPIAMVPFVAIGAPWLASPIALGWLAVGVARVARRLAAYEARARGCDAATI